MIAPFASLLLASGAFLTAQAAEYNKWECQQTDSYPYCTHVQSENAPDGGAWPVMCFLPGSGARGSLDNAASLAGYDGHGKLVSEYMGGNKDEAHSQAAEQFLTVVPIQADGTRHFDPDKVADIISEVQNNFNVDSSRIYISGYSMGARGTHRSLTFHPEIWAAGAPSAGAAEDSNADTLKQAYAPQDFNKLKAEVGIPVWSFAGQNDNTAGVDGSEATEKQVKSLGGNEFKLTIVPGADHSAMNIKPWTDYDLLTWFLQQSKNGASPSGAASASGSAVASGAASASGVASAPASTATGSSSGSGSGSSDDEDEDCDEEEDEGDDEDEDCDEDEDEDDDDDEEDCDDDEDESSDESSSGNSQQQPSGSGQATGSGQSDSNYGSPSGSGQATGSGQSDSNYGQPSGSGQATGSGQSDSNYGQASGSGQATGSGQSDSNYGTPSGSGSASGGSGSGSGSSGTSSAAGSSASGSSSPSSEDCDDSRLNRLRRRAATPEAPHLMERQAHHHVFSHSKRNWEVPLDTSMQHLAARQATSQDKAHRRALAKRSASSAAHGHGSFSRRPTAHGGHRGMSRIVRR